MILVGMCCDLEADKACITELGDKGYRMIQPSQAQKSAGPHWRPNNVLGVRSHGPSQGGARSGGEGGHGETPAPQLKRKGAPKPGPRIGHQLTETEIYELEPNGGTTLMAHGIGFYAR